MTRGQEQIQEMRRRMQIHWNNMELFMKRKHDDAYQEEDAQEFLDHCIKETRKEIETLAVAIEKWPF